MFLRALEIPCKIKKTFKNIIKYSKIKNERKKDLADFIKKSADIGKTIPSKAKCK